MTSRNSSMFANCILALLAISVLLFYFSKCVIIPAPADTDVYRLRKNGSHTFGVMFMSYGDDYAKYLEQLEMGIRNFKEMNPKVPVVVFAPEPPNVTVDHYRVTSKHGPREWHTRIINLWESPFDVTFSIDSQVMACAPLDVDDIMRRMKKYDLMLRPKWCDAKRKIDDVIEPAGCGFIFRKSENMKNLISTWRIIHESHGGKLASTDDQASLYRALIQRKKELNFTYMPPHWFTFVQKSEDGGNALKRRSAIIREMPWLFHYFDTNHQCSNFAAVTGPDPIGYQIVQKQDHKKLFEAVPVSTPHTCQTNVPCCSNETGNIVLEGMDL